MSDSVKEILSGSTLNLRRAAKFRKFIKPISALARRKRKVLVCTFCDKTGFGIGIGLSCNSNRRGKPIALRPVGSDQNYSPFESLEFVKDLQ